jgi:hypothetical protein
MLHTIPPRAIAGKGMLFTREGAVEAAEVMR